MSENNGGNPLDDEQDLWTIHINIRKSGKHQVRLDPPRERVHIFPDFNDGTREEIDRERHLRRTHGRRLARKLLK